MGRNRLNLLNKKFGYLKVLKEIKNKGYSLWLCQCICGKLKKYKGYDLNGYSYQSCGCKKGELIAIKNRYLNGKAGFNIVYNDYLRKSKLRKIEFKLSKKEFYKMTQNQCFYCGAKPYSIIKKNKFVKHFVYNGIDRKNPKKGYTKNNIVTCCKRCNYAKLNTPYKTFKLWIKNVYKKLYKK